MLLNEIAKETGMTKRAVKYYEEKGLLSVHKDGNGYRNNSPQDVETLKKISVYRKLGISIKDIQSLLKSGDKSILLRIYQEKMRESVLFEAECEALWTIYYYAMRYTGGFADLKDTIICGVVGLICVIFIVKRTINFLKRKKS